MTPNAHMFARTAPRLASPRTTTHAHQSSTPRQRRSAASSMDNITRERITASSSASSARADDRLSVFLSRPGRHAAFEAIKTSSKRVYEARDGRRVREYMSLPASQYSTLDGESVERIDDDTFRVEMSSFNFLGISLQPRLKARVYVREDGSGCEVRVDDMELRGSGVVEYASDAFEIVSVNNVTWRDVRKDELTERECEAIENGGGDFKEITSETRVSVYLIIPGWFPFTVKSTERTGRFVVNQVVSQVVPRFLSQLATDYAVWATGDDSRAASANGMFDVDVEE